ncbi:bifunctional 2-polyprenyl-6-hydroxyphenol methylase/3-demethylubiquinol 3-O-methyltransferase UbiG [Subtercola sp. PAMC28395]|uniref:class I SAM-dependent methyltransferase n=1 Tax=Subtercola sp. PAMC28395 TaxID=2846775 RepID=UPI00209AC29F|nr:methyltransferase domain-containing protein [Subtercola sp. PAMC28395]
MSTSAPAALTPTHVPTFGSGGGDPYARALRGEGRLHLVRQGAVAGNAATASATSTDNTTTTTTATTTTLDIARWRANADATDMSLIEEGTGPLLDIGCGPGRMVRAASGVGYRALGIDVSQAAIDLASSSGASVLRASVFDELPLEGRWMTALLVDGNIGIGGDPSRLLARCAQLLAPAGCVLVEVENDHAADSRFDCTVTSDDGHTSDAFPWAEIGSHALAHRSVGAGLRMVESWSRDGRTFCRLAPAV